MIRIALADDHQIMREGLVSLLREQSDFTVVAEATSAVRFYELLGERRSEPPDVAVLDINLPGIDGFDLAETVREEFPEMRIVFLTSRQDPAAIKRARAIGVGGYVLKADAFDHLVAAIRAVAAGGTYLSEESEYLVRKEASQLGKLSPRELEILTEISRGRINKEIGERLGISVFTVRTHRNRLMEKLDLHSVSDLVRFAIDHGIE